MAANFNVQFIINEKTQSRVIRLTDTSTGYVLTKGLFSVTFPDGSTRIKTDFNSPDITAPSGSVDIMAVTDANGVLSGQYKIDFVGMDASSNTYSSSKQFDFNFETPENGIIDKSDSIIPQVQFFDSATYSPNGSFTGTATRQFKTTMPSNSAVSGQVITSTTNTLTPVVSSNYYEGIYAVTNEVAINYTHSSYSWLTIAFTGYYTKSIDVRQTPTQLELVEKINTYRDYIDALKNKNDSRFEILSEKYDLLIALYTHLIARYELALLDGSQPILEEMLSILEPYTTHTYKSTPMTTFELAYSSGFNVSDGTNTDLVSLGQTLSFLSSSGALSFLVGSNSVTITPTFGTTANTFAQGNDARFHNAVTLGTTNGLSLINQQLSLAAATPSSAGAMTASDKTKIDAIPEPSTIGSVKSVGLSMPAAFTVAGSPITSSGVLAVSAAGTALQYVKGDGTLATLNTGAVPENGSLYFTNARARAAISVNGSLSYNNVTGIISYTTPAETDPIYTASSWYTTTNNSSNWNTAYGWGNHALAGYLLASVAASTYQPLDADLTAIAALAGTAGFLKKTAANTWTLDTSTYLTAETDPIYTASSWYNTANNSANWNTAYGWGNHASAGYLTSISGISAGGELTGTYPNPSLSNTAVIGKVLTGLNITGSTISATDSILIAFGKLQSQINGLVGSVIYQGTWNASTNTPTLTSSSGTKGYYYKVSVEGTTSLNGISDWKVGDWVIYNGSAWEKVDNTDSVSSVNGLTGAVSLTTSNISEGTNLYYTDSRARASLSFTAGSGGYNSTTGVITIPTNTNQLTNGASFITLASLSASAPLSYNSSTGVFSITQAGASTNGFLSSTDWNTFNNKQNALTNPVTGTGTTNYLPKFTGSTTLGNSTITENSNGVAIGGTAGSGQKFQITGILTGATIVRSIMSVGQIYNDVTAQVVMYYSQPSTIPFSFTLSNLYHYQAEQGSIGAGSTVTNQYGFFVGSSLVGATNNYGFYGNIPSGTGRWNLYMNGTAANYLSGGLSIGTTSTSYFLNVSSSVSGNFIANFDNTSTSGASGIRIKLGSATGTFISGTNSSNSTAFFVTAEGNARFYGTKLSLGADINPSNYTSNLIIQSANNEGITIANSTFTSTGENYLYFSKDVFSLNTGFIGYNYASDYLRFGTNGSEVARFSNTGNLSIGNTNNTYKLDVSGDINISTGSVYRINGTAYSVASTSNSGFLTSTDWNTFNNKQNALGYTPVPTTRTLTINGTTYDLSADRSWTISAGSSSLSLLTDVTITSVANGQLLQYSSASSKWVNWTPNYLTANQNITISGDASGSGTTAITLTLANSGVTAGSYGSASAIPVITVDAKGRVTSVSTQAVSIVSTLAGLSDVTITTPSNGQLLQYNSTSSKWVNWTPNYLTGNQSITISGDATGSGTTAITLTLANSGVTAGTYRSVTVDAKGRVTAGTNPTTVSGYGITDILAQVVTGYAVGTNTAVTNTDTIETAIEKLQGQVNARISGNQTITLSGDATGSGTTAITVTLANSGVTAGTYTKVTVDAKGRVTSGATLASADLPTYTGTLTSSQVTTALGYTPYNSTNPNGYTSNTGTVTSVSGTGSVAGLSLSGTVTTSGSITLGGTLSASIDNIVDEHRVFNNMGDNHSTRTSFDATSPSYNFGWRYVQGNTNSPNVNAATQYYSLYIGLGNDYLATGAGSYGMMLAIPRNVTTPYLAIRYNENNTFAAWQKISAGYADSAGSVAWTNVSGRPTALSSFTNDSGYITSSSVGNGTLTLAVSGTGLSGSATFSANQSSAATFTVTSNATSANTASTIVARDASGNFTAGTITAALSGNATTATTLQTARTITIGSTGKTFNGSANVSWTLAEIGAQAAGSYLTAESDTLATVTSRGASTSTVLDLNGTVNFNAVNSGGSGDYTNVTSPNLKVSVSSGIWRIVHTSANVGTSGVYNYESGKNVIWGESTDTGVYNFRGRTLRYTNSVGANFDVLHVGNYNSYAPTLTGGGASGTWGINITGNAASASSVAWTNVSGRPTALSSFTNDSGYITSSSLSSYLPLSGGTMTGKITTPSSGSDVYGGAIEIRERGYVLATQSDWSYSPAITFHWGNRWAKRFGGRADGQFAIDDVPIVLNTGTWGISITGNAATATTLQTARTINGVSFNGSANITVTANTTNSLTLAVSGTGLSGSASFNGSAATTFTVTSNATSANTASAIVARDASGNFTAGTITATNFTETSSIRYKENVIDLSNPLEKVSKLRGVSYNRKGTSKTEIGVIAEEVVPVLPEVITHLEDGQIDSVAYGRFTALLIEAVKEQQKQINELKELLNKK